jgi:phosphoethanolamine N-methyltransferase
MDRAERADILAQLPPLEGRDVLELGAGIGRYTSYFAQVARHVTAVDFVERFIEEHRRTTVLFNNTSYYCTDVMDLEFEDVSFDFVFINWLFMYLDDQQVALLRDRIKRWTRSEAMVFFRESCFVGSTGTPPSKDNPLAIDRMRNTLACSTKTSACLTEATSKYMKNSSTIPINTIGSLKGSC